MKSRHCGFSLLLTALLTASAAYGAHPSPQGFGLVPWPRSLTTSKGTFTTPAQWTVAAATPDERAAAEFVSAYLRNRGTTVYVQNIPAATVRLRLVKDRAIPSEGYHLRVDAHGIAIEATSGSGLFYGVQTLEELVESQGAKLAFVDIVDAPRFAWRGIHLDVARHFFPVPVVERYIDVAAHYKLNVFHWHLTDDQGWRIEIKQEPLLTTIGACRDGTEVGRNPNDIDRRRYCGYYTQAQIREIVQYARNRYMTVVPEIEMPGHADASIAAYPSLSCTGERIRVREIWGTSGHIYCPSETTFAFIDTVLGEVASLFPGPLVHVGGDEVTLDEWRQSSFVRQLMMRRHFTTYAQVQAYFEQRVGAILAKYERRMAAWDDVLDDGVGDAGTIVSWHSVERGIKAAGMGNDVVMSPDGPLYFDAYQGDPQDEPLAIGGLSRLQDVYDFDPLPRGVPKNVAQHVIGVQANLWTEYIATSPYLFYMLLPRELALSEVAWSSPPRDWDSFQTRSATQYAWLERTGETFRIPNPQFVVGGAANAQIANVSPSLRTTVLHVDNARLTVSLQVPVSGATIHYTMDGTLPTERSDRYRRPIVVHLRPGSERDIIAICVAGGRTSTPTELIVRR